MNPQTTPHPGAPSASNVLYGSTDAQIGVVQGDAVFHRHESIYQINPGDPPERKYRVARSRLEGGTPRVAEELIGEVLRVGHVSSEIVFYYVLSILSDRSLNQLGKAEFDNVNFAMYTAGQFSNDGWLAALGTIRRLLSCVERQERGSDPGLEELRAVLGDFRRLPTDRQADITRHLHMILNGAVQDALDAVNAEMVVSERMSGNRGQRAWKFFQPDPAPPVPAMARPPVSRPGPWVKAVLGGIGALLGLWSLVDVLAVNPVQAGLSFVAFFGGGLIAMRYGLERVVLADRLRDKAFEYDGRVAATVPPDLPVPPWFVARVFAMVEARFDDQRQHNGGTWDWDVAGVKEALKTRLVLLYGQPLVEPAALSWLVRWHAQRVAEQWRAGTLFDFRQTLRPTALVNGLFRLGVVLAAAGALGLATAGTGADFVAALFLAGGGYLAGRNGTQIIAGRRCYAQTQAEYDELFGQEQQAYEAWAAVLRDRPTDAEMARWLEFDTFYVKTMAMRRSGLTNRDVIAHVVLTEGAPTAMRGRVYRGPVRYSAYIVLVFLLTEGGMREVEIDLDFLNGALYHERRTSFSYQALASAQVAEVSVQFAGSRRQVKLVNRNNITHDQAALVFSQAFWLSLVNSQEIVVVVENFNGVADQTENKNHLMRLALETSGITTALYILEAVAAEGPEWIRRERERRTRRWQEWGRSGNTPPALAGPRVPIEAPAWSSPAGATLFDP